MGLAFSPLPCLSRPRRASPPFRRAKDAGDPRGAAVPSGPFPRGLACPFRGIGTGPGNPRDTASPFRPISARPRLPFPGGSEPGPTTPAARRVPSGPSPPTARPCPPFPGDRNRARQPPRRGGPFRPFPAQPRLPFPGDRNRARQSPRHSESFPAHPHPPRGLARPFRGIGTRPGNPRGATSPFRPLPAHCTALPALSGGSKPDPAPLPPRRGDSPSGPFPRGLACPFRGIGTGPGNPRGAAVPSGLSPHGLVRPFRGIGTGPGNPRGAAAPSGPFHRAGSPAASPPAVPRRGSFPGSTSPPRAAASLPFPFQACRDLLPAQEEHV